MFFKLQKIKKKKKAPPSCNLKNYTGETGKLFQLQVNTVPRNKPMPPPQKKEKGKKLSCREIRTH